MILIVSLLLVLNFILFHMYSSQKKTIENYRDNALEAITTHEDMKETLRIGLYHRYKRDLVEDKVENPLLFEHFVAEIMTSVRGGSTYVTKGSGDYGVDIEEETNAGLYLGQVKCYNDYNPVSFDPIAIIHSQMVKQGAIGGYLITTGKFTANAYNYANELNIDLIDGNQLVELWLEHLDSKRELVSEFKALPAT
ncbi:restriction endonuclease [Paenibacillus sp. An7]|uniref:restriction endonuclease n=1 Tax=Paenibacillus sp. An7 TaxID=2689577 RepID=UPI001359497B|nr:restriction endonuclease [Paenibacillus sp. An7]